MNSLSSTIRDRCLARLKKQGVKKAEPAVQPAPAKPRYVKDFVSFKKDGDKILQLITSLNASRLSTWGFTAEAEMEGFTEYQLTAVLDHRTSDFCRLINKRRFQVEDAVDLVNRALSVENPDDVKAIQPWPSQSKASLENFKKMSSAELTALNLHIPPFHPRCRTLLTRVGKAPNLGKDFAPPTEAPQVVPTPATPQDFKDLGIDVTQTQLDQWNAYLERPPVEVVSALTGQTPLEVMLETKVGVGITKDDLFNVKAKGVYGPGKFDMSVILDPYTGTVYRNYAELDKLGGVAAARFIKQLHTGLLEAGEVMAAKEVAVAATGSGAYVYAKLGAVPSAGDWGTLRFQMLEEIAPDGIHHAAFTSLPPKQQTIVTQILSQNHEDGMMALADLKVSVNGKPIAEVLLQDKSYTAYVDLTDPDKLAKLKALLS